MMTHQHTEEVRWEHVPLSLEHCLSESHGTCTSGQGPLLLHNYLLSTPVCRVGSTCTGGSAGTAWEGLEVHSYSPGCKMSCAVAFLSQSPRGSRD